MLKKDQMTKVTIQVSNFIEEPEEVVYYEESFPGEFDDGVVVDYEETSFDEEVQGSFFGHLSLLPHFIELLLVIGEARFQTDHPGVHVRKILRR